MGDLVLFMQMIPLGKKIDTKLTSFFNSLSNTKGTQCFPKRYYYCIISYFVTHLPGAIDTSIFSNS